MKENKLFIILIIVFVLLLAVVVFESIDFFDNNEPNKEYTTHQDITLLGTDILREVEEDYIITTYEDYKSITNSPIIKKEDFTNNNYLLLSIDYDPCSESNIKPYDYAVKNDIALIKVAYDAGCGVCPPQTTYFVLKVNKSITKLTTKYDYVIASQNIVILM